MTTSSAQAKRIGCICTFLPFHFAYRGDLKVMEVKAMHKVV